MKKQQKIVIISFIIAIIIFLLFFIIGYSTFKSPYLKDFDIISLDETDKGYEIKFKSNLFAVRYVVNAKDENGNIFYTKESKDINNKDFTTIVLDDLMPKFNQKILVEVVAFDKTDVFKKTTKDWEMTWTKPSFSDDNYHYVEKNQNFKIKLDGDIEAEEYKLNLFYENNIVMEEKIKSNVIEIAYTSLAMYSGKLTLAITKSDVVYNKFNFYINTVLVGNVKIVKPVTNTYFDWGDVSFAFEGGINATNYYLDFYSDNKFIKSIRLIDNETVIDAYNFDAETKYTLVLKAIYEDYEEISKTDSIDIEIGEILKVQPVYTDYNFTDVPYGSIIQLKTKTRNAVIKYTTDGSSPAVYGKVYDKPFVITEDMTLKTFALKDKYLPSEINTYEINVNDNKIPIIYLSPSKQSYNQGVHSVGYSNEFLMMNKVCDYVEKRLKEVGFKVYRNNPINGIPEWTAESRYLNADLHFAIHSNASLNHNQQGVEIYVHTDTSPGLSIANRIYDNLYSIYPYNNKPRTNRGVKFAEGLLGEVNPANVKTGVLVEIAYHDQIDDARWIVNNIQKIGYNLADSIIEFYHFTNGKSIQ